MISFLLLLNMHFIKWFDISRSWVDNNWANSVHFKSVPKSSLYAFMQYIKRYFVMLWWSMWCSIIVLICKRALMPCQKLNFIIYDSMILRVSSSRCHICVCNPTICSSFSHCVSTFFPFRLPETNSQLSVNLSNSPRSVKTAIQSQETSDIAVLSPRTNRSSQSSPGKCQFSTWRLRFSN